MNKKLIVLVCLLTATSTKMQAKGELASAAVGVVFGVGYNQLSHLESQSVAVAGTLLAVLAEMIVAAGIAVANYGNHFEFLPDEAKQKLAGPHIMAALASSAATVLALKAYEFYGAPSKQEPSASGAAIQKNRTS